MTTATEPRVTAQKYRVFIKATPQAIWDAITDPEWTQRYGYGVRSEYELRPGGAYRVLATEEMRALGAAEVLIDGEVIEADPPRKLVQTWRALWDADLIAEGHPGNRSSRKADRGPLRRDGRVPRGAAAGRGPARCLGTAAQLEGVVDQAGGFRSEPVRRALPRDAGRRANGVDAPADLIAGFMADSW